MGPWGFHSLVCNFGKWCSVGHSNFTFRIQEADSTSNSWNTYSRIFTQFLTSHRFPMENFADICIFSRNSYFFDSDFSFIFKGNKINPGLFLVFLMMPRTLFKNLYVASLIKVQKLKRRWCVFFLVTSWVSHSPCEGVIT